MPLVEVKLFDTRLEDPAKVKKLIEGITDAVCAATSEETRPRTWVIVEGIPRAQWGHGGIPAG